MPQTLYTSGFEACYVNRLIVFAKKLFFLIPPRNSWKIKENSLSLQTEPINRNDSMKPNHNQKSKTSPFDSLRIIFVLFALLSSQTLFSQDLENRRVPVAGFFSDVYDK